MASLARDFCAWLAAGIVGTAVPGGSAHAEMRQCSEQRVEYLIGGAGKSGTSGGKTCGNAIVGDLAGARELAAERRKNGAAPSQGAARFAKFDDEARREILLQELRLARQYLADLDRSQTALPGAGTLQEQRTRRQGDITALESELGRLKTP
jgi:hypothetical protein